MSDSLKGDQEESAEHFCVRIDNLLKECEELSNMPLEKIDKNYLKAFQKKVSPLRMRLLREIEAPRKEETHG